MAVIGADPPHRMSSEARGALPATIFFFVGFNFIILTTNLLVADYAVAVSNFMLATVAAFVVGKAVITANAMPFLKLFDRVRHRPPSSRPALPFPRQGRNSRSSADRRRTLLPKTPSPSRRQCDIFLHGVALLSGIDTPSLPAQGGQRRPFRSSTSNGTSPVHKKTIAVATVTDQASAEFGVYYQRLRKRWQVAGVRPCLWLPQSRANHGYTNQILASEPDDATMKAKIMRLLEEIRRRR